MKHKKLISKTNIILSLLLIIFTILSFMIRNLPGGQSHWALFGNGSIEYGFIENIQNIILIYCIYLHIKNRKYFRKIFGFFPYFLRIGTLIFLFYEEISFLTEGRIKNIESINFQSELNFHQLKYLDNNILSNINVPFFDYTFSITYSVFLFSIILFIIGFGNYLKFFPSLRFLSWEKKYSYYSLVFFINIALGSILSNLGFLRYSFLIEPELIELFIYIIFVLDTHSKVKKIKGYKNFMI